MADQIILFRAVDANGEPAGGAVARFYDAGTTTPLTVYTTNALSVAHGTAITADAAGNFAPAWVASGTAVKVEVEDSAGAALNAFTRDNFPTSAEDAGTASDVSFTPTAEIPASTVQDAIERVQTNLGVAAVSSFAQTLLDDANAAASRTTLGLGSAATLTAGTGANNLVQLNGSAQLPALDGSLLTGTTGFNSAGETATTSGTSVDFTSLPSGLNWIDLIFNGVSLSGSSNLLVQLGDSGGVETTGYISTCAITASSGQSQRSSTSGLILSMTLASVAAIGIMSIRRVPGTNTWISSHSMRMDTNFGAQGGGSKTLSGTLDRVRIGSENGTDTLDAGGVSIHYG